jgi:hypothetical protein
VLTCTMTKDNHCSEVMVIFKFIVDCLS